MKTIVLANPIGERGRNNPKMKKWHHKKRSQGLLVEKGIFSKEEFLEMVRVADQPVRMG